MPESRYQKYPLVCMALTPEEVAELRESAKRQRYVSRTGPQPGGLARDLFPAMLPRFRAAKFDPAAVAEPNDDIRDWLYALYKATQPDMRGHFRTLADRIGFPEPPPPEMFDEGRQQGEIPKAANEGNGPKSIGKRRL